MRAVPLSAYVVLLVAMTSEGPAHAQENSDQLAAVQATVNQNAEALSLLTETLNTIIQTLTNMNSMLHLVAHPDMDDSCEFNGLLYSNGSTAKGVCKTQTCTNGVWKFERSISDPLCCEYKWSEALPDGSTIEEGSCKPTCTKGEWTIDNSTLCCVDMDRRYLFPWFESGSYARNWSEIRSCEDGNWNIYIFYPVLEFRLEPREENVKSTLIRYTPGVHQDYRAGCDEGCTHWDDMNYGGMNYWVDSINNFISWNRYEPGHYYGYSPYNFTDCSDDHPANRGETCQFDLQWLGDKCTKAEDWGYSGRSGSAPCVILKMSRMTGWTPDVYQSIEELPADMPEDLKQHIKMKTDENGGNVPKMVWMHCKCENPAHEEYIREIEYTPWQGFPTYYFPHMDSGRNLDPIVAVRFDAPANNVPINIECKAYTKNIVHSQQERLGVIHFELTKLG